MRKSHLRAADPEMAFETNKPRCDLGSCSTVLNLQMRTLRSKEVKEIVQGYSCQVKETKGNYVFGCFQILVRFCVLSPQHLATCQLWQLWKVCVVMLVRVITNVPLTSWKGLIPHYVSFCLWRGEFQWKKTLLLRGFQGAPVWLSW